MNTPNLPIIAAEIARRIPEMHRDTAINNAAVIENLLREEFARDQETLRVLREWGGRCQDEMEHQAQLYQNLLHHLTEAGICADCLKPLRDHKPHPLGGSACP